MIDIDERADEDIVITDGKNNFLMVYEYPGVWQVHYLFEDRGKVAVTVAKQMFATAFRDYDCKTVFGLIPVENKASRWFTRHLGIKSYGIKDTEVGPCELFTLTKEEHETWVV